MAIDQKSVENWFRRKNWTLFPFQKKCWSTYQHGQSGLLNAPTGSGKTYALLLPAMAMASQHPQKGIRILWITPLKTLSREIYRAATQAADALHFDGEVAIRTGDSTALQKRKIVKKPPTILITTPESLHILLSQAQPLELMSHLSTVIVDEWHELMGSKRGVQLQLALSWLAARSSLQIWGISATIGNLREAEQALLGHMIPENNRSLVRANSAKPIQMTTLLPDKIETFPWAGHLGIKMLEQVIQIVEASPATLIFTNTRSQCEIWYQRILEQRPDWAGWVAMHHGSMSRELRDWVEAAIHNEHLKAVVCTSSLDLGVDFRPVETVVQIGSPKGVARMIQRAGRSGHQPGATSNIYFAPTHSLEILEGAALKAAINRESIENRIPYLLSYDVLLQYMMTLASGPGFSPIALFAEVKNTYAYNSLQRKDFQQLLEFLFTGGNSLQSYSEYRKVAMDRNGIVRALNASIARRHRMSIGTITSDLSLRVKYTNGRQLGTIEEWFISQLKPGEVFQFAGKTLELKKIRDGDVMVKKSNKNIQRIPSWMGSRMPLSSQLSQEIRQQIQGYLNGEKQGPELQKLIPLFELQQLRSALPGEEDFLIEHFRDKEGDHLVFYPFEGRFVHEGLGALLAYRLSKTRNISFSIAMNDYGLELLTDQRLETGETELGEILSTNNLSGDIQRSINEVEMARRRFRDIASISGLIFQGFPGQKKRERHLQSSAGLIFEVFQNYDPENLLYLQAFDELRNFQLEEGRMRQALKRIAGQQLLYLQPEKATPFSFPIIVDRLRERMSNESLERRIAKMKKGLVKTRQR